jgi:hypothetical protein
MMTPLPGLVKVQYFIADCLLRIREAKIPHEVLHETAKFIAGVRKEETQDDVMQPMFR